MGLLNYLLTKHHEDLAAKALRRIRDGFPLPGDITLARKHFGDFGDLLDTSSSRKGKARK